MANDETTEEEELTDEEKALLTEPSEDMEGYGEPYAEYPQTPMTRYERVAAESPYDEEPTSLRDIPFDDPALTDAHMMVESGGDPDAVSEDNAQGLFQIIPATWKRFADEGDDPRDPEANQKVRNRYLNWLSDRYGGDTELALQAYYAGEGNVDKAIQKTGSTDPDTIAQYFRVTGQPRSAKYIDQMRTAYAKQADKEARGDVDYSHVRKAQRGNVPSEFPEVNAAPGTGKEVVDKWLAFSGTDGYADLTFDEKMKALSSMYSSRSRWSSDGITALKEVASTIWDESGADAGMSYADFVPEVPLVKAGGDVEGEIHKWKAKTFKSLREDGINPIFLGSDFDKYVDKLATEEKVGYATRNRSIVGHALNRGGNYARDLFKGVATLLTVPAAGVVRFGLRPVAPETSRDIADTIESLPAKFGEGELSYLNKTNPITQRPIVGPYGNYVPHWQSQALQTIGNVAAYVATIKASAAKFAAGKVAAAAIGTNALQSLEGAYQETLQEGGTDEQGITAGLMSVAPSTAAGLVDLLLINGAPPYLKGLKGATQMRLASKHLLKQGFYAGTSNFLQQGIQSDIVGRVLGRDVQSTEKLSIAALSGVVGGVLGSGVDFLVGVKPEPIAIDANTSRREVAKMLMGVEKNVPIKIFTARPEEYREFLKMPEMQGRQVEMTGFYPDRARNDAYTDEARTVIQKLVDFRESHAKDMPLTVREAYLLDEDLLHAFDFKKTEDGKSIVISKDSDYVAIEATELPDVIKQIEVLSKKLEGMPTDADVANLVSRKERLTKLRDHYGRIYKLSLDDHAVFTGREVLAAKADSAFRVLEGAQERKKVAQDPASKASYDKAVTVAKHQYDLAQKELEAYDNRFASILSKPTANLRKILTELHHVSNQLKALPSDGHLNNVQAMQRHMADLINRKSILERQREEEIDALKQQAATTKSGEAAKRRKTLKMPHTPDSKMLEGVGGLTMKDGHTVMFSNDRWWLFDKDNKLIYGDSSYKEVMKHTVKSIREAKRQEAELKKAERAAAADAKRAEDVARTSSEEALAAKEASDFTSYTGKKKAAFTPDEELTDFDEPGEPKDPTKDMTDEEAAAYYDKYFEEHQDEYDKYMDDLFEEKWKASRTAMLEDPNAFNPWATMTKEEARKAWDRGEDFDETSRAESRRTRIYRMARNRKPVRMEDAGESPPRREYRSGYPLHEDPALIPDIDTPQRVMLEQARAEVDRLNNELKDYLKNNPDENIIHPSEKLSSLLYRAERAEEHYDSLIQENDLSSSGESYTPKSVYEVEAEQSKNGNVYSKTLSKETRNLVNFLLDGMGLTNVHLFTKEDLFQKNVLDFAPEGHERSFMDFIKSIQRNNPAGSHRLSPSKKGDATFMMIDSPSLTKDTAITLSHEIGHSFIRKQFHTMPVKVLNEIIADFNERQTKVQLTPDMPYGEAIETLRGSSRKSEKFEQTKLTPWSKAISPRAREALISETRLAKVPSNISAEAYKATVDKLLSNRAFNEYLAQRFAQWATKGTSPHFKDVPRLFRGTGKSMLESIGMKLKDMWEAIKARFGEVESFDSWLDSHFDKALALGMFKTADSGTIGKGKGDPFDTRTGEQKVSKTAANLAAGKLAVSAIYDKDPNLYFVRGMEKGKEAVENFVNVHGREAALDMFDKRAQSDDIKGFLAAAITRSYEQDIRKAQKAGNQTLADDLRTASHSFLNKHIEEATMRGQYINALKALKELSLEGMISFHTTKMLQSNKSARMMPEGTFKDITRKVVSDFYEDFITAPEGLLQAVVQNAMLKEWKKQLADTTGSSFNTMADIGWFYWYGNILSGATTQTVNAAGGGIDLGLRTLLKVAYSAVIHPKDAIAMISSIGRGLNYASKEFWGTMRGRPIGAIKNLKLAKAVADTPIFKITQHQTNAFIARMGSKRPELRGALKAAGRTTLMAAKVVDAGVQGYLNFLTFWPFRFMNAADAFIGRTAHEMQAAYVASRMARDYVKANKLSREAYADKFHEFVNDRGGAWEKAVLDAEVEWQRNKNPHVLNFNLNDKYLRAIELIELGRPMEVRVAAERYALERTYNNIPEGIGAYISDIITAITSRVDSAINAGSHKPRIPLAKMIAPFNRVVSNLLSSSLDYSPIGIARGVSGYHVSDWFNRPTKMVPELDAQGKPVVDSTGKPVMKEVGIKFSPEERAERIATGLASTIIAGAVMSYLEQYLEDPDPEVAIYGAGPRDIRNKQNFKAQGHTPYSIYVKALGGSIRYTDLAIAPLLAFIGSWHDARRWDKQFKQKELMERMESVMPMAASVVTEVSTLKSLSEFWDMMTGQKSWSSPALRAVKGFVPVQGLLRDYSYMTDKDAVDQKDVASLVSYGIPYWQSASSKVMLNALGEPLKKTPRFFKEMNIDKTWKFLGQNGLQIPGVSGQIIIGEGASSSEKARQAYYLKNREKALGRLAFNIFTDHEAYELTKIAGPRIKARLQPMLSIKVTKDNKEAIQERIDKIVQEERARAKLEILQRSDAAIKAGKELR